MRSAGGTSGQVAIATAAADGTTRQLAILQLLLVGNIASHDVGLVQMTTQCMLLAVAVVLLMMQQTALPHSLAATG
jgi:hypothetical protein